MTNNSRDGLWWNNSPSDEQKLLSINPAIIRGAGQTSPPLNITDVVMRVVIARSLRVRVLHVTAQLGDEAGVNTRSVMLRCELS